MANLTAKCKDHKIPVWEGEEIKFSPKLEIFDLFPLVYYKVFSRLMQIAVKLFKCDDYKLTFLFCLCR